MLDFLPEKIKDALTHLNQQFLYEIRLRADKPTTIHYNEKYVYLGQYGIVSRAEQAIYSDVFDIENTLYKAGEYSVYSVEEQLKKGFITARNGERLGVAGEFVFEHGKPLSIRNYTSLCIRVPHEIIGCGQEIYQKCMSDKIRSILIASPPGIGKTTILRDLARIISEYNHLNVLICDERGEISAGNVGETCDVLKFAEKEMAFHAGIRAMRPDVIITDELSTYDCSAVEKAVFSGVKVLASAHFSQMDSVKKPFLDLFERFVFLNPKKIGEILAIFNEEGKEIR